MPSVAAGSRKDVQNILFHDHLPKLKQFGVPSLEGLRGEVGKIQTDQSEKASG